MKYVLLYQQEVVIRVQCATKSVRIVVGANVGLGFEGMLCRLLFLTARIHFLFVIASKQLARTVNPKRLMLACRNQIRGDEAANCMYC